MVVECLRGEGLRNIRRLDFRPCPGVNIIYGANGQGKTNLLEGIWMFCGGRSFRGSRESEYPSFDLGYMRLELEFFGGGRSQEAQVYIGPRGKRVLLGGVKLERLSALWGVFGAVVFSPDHLELVKLGPRERRRLLDTSLCAAYPKYGKVLESYERVLRHRAALLRDIRQFGKAAGMLEIWDEALARYGGYITWMRIRYLSKLAGYADKFYDGISGGREKFSAEYAAGTGEIPSGASREDITGMLSRAVSASLGEDIRLGSTSIGPHRDDISLTLDGRAARAFGSQGQQRSLVLALKLAECQILEESAGEPPVVLLDDVMSELDENRRQYLLDNLGGKQVIITCCEPSALGQGKLFHMEQGILSEV